MIPCTNPLIVGRRTTSLGTSMVRCLTRSSTSSTSSSPSFHAKFQGVYPIVVTPFLDNAQESLDLDSLRRCITWFYRAKCQGVTIAGVLGESNRMTDRERESIVCVTRETITELEQQESQNKDTTRARFTLCVGTSHSGTAATVAQSLMAKELGADAVMVAPSKDQAGAQPSDDDILTLYHRVADACGPDLDIVLQDHPSSTGVILSLNLMARIAMEVPSVRCIKLESLPTVERLQGLKNHHPDVLQRCNILTGLGALYAGIDLEQGMTSGFMTGFAFPEILQAMNHHVQAGDYRSAHLLYRKFLPLIVLEQMPVAGLALRKEIYRMRGWIDSAHVRHPGKNLTPTLRRVLQAELERFLPGVIDLSQPLPDEILKV